MRVHNTSMMNEFPYLYRGVIVDNNDPKKLGRCKIKVPSIHGNNAPASYLPWARCISNVTIGNTRGSASVPDIGDIVWVFFEGGDKDSPVYLGGTHGTPDLPVKLEEIVLYQEDDDRVYYNRDTRTFDIKIGPNHVIVNPEIVHIIGETIIDGDTLIVGNLHVTGTIKSDTDVIGGGVSLRGHTHGGVENGPSNTSRPN